VRSQLGVLGFGLQISGLRAGKITSRGGLRIFAIPFRRPAGLHCRKLESHEEREIMTSNNATSVLVEDDTAVRAVLDDVYAAWADNDADAFAASYAEDATAVLPGSYLKDKEAVRATMAAVFAGPLKGSSAIHEVQSIRFPGTGTAIVISKGAVLLAGQDEPAAETRSVDTWVLSGRDGTWRVEAFHNCPEHAS